jgi:hypothetical protein
MEVLGSDVLAGIMVGCATLSLGTAYEIDCVAYRPDVG